MTREEAISLLRRYRRVYRYNAGRGVFIRRNIPFQTCIYGRVLIDWIIQGIRNSDNDPIEVVRNVYSNLDWVLGESDDDHFETHRFAALMEREAGSLLQYLKWVEKERSEDAKG